MDYKKHWPENGLEVVAKCPWCHSNKSQVLYEGLSDIVFGTAPGVWTFLQCKECASGYLSPRPTLDTIHLAYRQYYTHAASFERGSSGIKGLLKYFRLALVNGYRNKIYNSHFSPSIRAGFYLTRLRTRTTRIIEDDLRYIPPILMGTTPKILDIGCGNLGFLRLVSQGGWQAFGCDLDPEIKNLITETDSIDLRVGSSEVFLEEAGSFDVITLSHVIEHIHDPIAELERIFILLRPGGFLYIDAPNIESFGHHFWSRYWLGLDAPRHLSLPTSKVLSEALIRLGFIDIKFIERPGIWGSISVKSARLELGKAYNDPSSDHALRMPKTPPFGLRGSEFLTLTAVKPV